MLIPPPLSLYVHLPWCVRKCPYCDFNSHAAKGELPFDAYVNALMRDLEYDLPLVWGRVVNSVFFGGGTPSLFPPDAIDCFLQMAAARLRFAPDIEITLETNPGTAEYGRFDRYLAAGVNRLSFGIQSFGDDALRLLGRIHDSAQAEYAVKLAQDAGFTNINLDLMYALPEQTLAEVEHDLQRAFALAPTHLSHYQLMLEPNTIFYARPPHGIPEDDVAWEMQEHGQRLLAEAGYHHYEISAYAREGWQCMHNLNYWRFGDYLGIGAGAHSKISSGVAQHVLRRWKRKHPQTYLESAGTLSAIGGDEIVPAARLPFEYMLNLLRLHEGFRLQDFAVRTGLAVEAINAPLLEATARGLLQCDLEQVIPTELGLRFANDVINLFDE